MYTVKQVKSIPKNKLLEIIDLGKSYIKDSNITKKIFNDYDTDIEYIDYIPVIFSDLDVSAKTDKGVIYLNYKLLCDGSFFKDLGYLVHEMTHVLQQITSKKALKGTDGMKGNSYLSSKEEIEAFQNQIDYLKDEFGKHEAEKYVDHLLSYHKINGKNKKNKKDQLLNRS